MPLQFEWSPWIPLNGSWLRTNLPSQPGLYRVRRVGFDGVDYIGQTKTLKKRAGMLRGVYRAEMPYRDPHTAAPALWALRDSLGCDFEISVMVVEGTRQWRQGLEAAAIARYRQELERSREVTRVCSPELVRVFLG